MNSSGHLTATESAPRRLKKVKAQRRTRARTRNSKKAHHADGEYHSTMAAAGTLTRTKALLLAALRVWELKRRVGE